jgi:three-Cys-motif partner protein
MAKDINKDKFSEATKLKLDIFAECFREWFPVFIHNPYTKSIFIYDFFAGSGKDAEGTLGSPLILLNQAKGDKCKYCSSSKKNDKHVYFAFNEKEKNKFDVLVTNINEFMQTCLERNCKAEQWYLWLRQLQTK